MSKNDRISELQEKKDEFILNESVFADDHPSWLEVAEAEAEAERKWDETDEGKELKALLESVRDAEVEINSRFLEADTTIRVGAGLVMFTPPLDDEYWLFRVKLTDKQAIVGFPKFGTIGIGFQVEDYDWNTNLPFSCEPQKNLRSHQRKQRRRLDFGGGLS